MPQYTPPLRDMQFLMHEVLNVVDELKALPAHARSMTWTWPVAASSSTTSPVLSQPSVNAAAVGGALSTKWHVSSHPRMGQQPI